MPLREDEPLGDLILQLDERRGGLMRDLRPRPLFTDLDRPREHTSAQTSAARRAFLDARVNFFKQARHTQDDGRAHLAHVLADLVH